MVPEGHVPERIVATESGKFTPTAAFVARLCSSILGLSRDASQWNFDEDFPS
jgi:hypothetical protein